MRESGGDPGLAKNRLFVLLEFATYRARLDRSAELSFLGGQPYMFTTLPDCYWIRIPADDRNYVARQLRALACECREYTASDIDAVEVIKILIDVSLRVVAQV